MRQTGATITASTSPRGNEPHGRCRETPPWSALCACPSFAETADAPDVASCSRRSQPDPAEMVGACRTARLVRWVRHVVWSSTCRGAQRRRVMAASTEIHSANQGPSGPGARHAHQRWCGDGTRTRPGAPHGAIHRPGARSPDDWLLRSYSEVAPNGTEEQREGPRARAKWKHGRPRGRVPTKSRGKRRGGRAQPIRPYVNPRIFEAGANHTRGVARTW